MPWLVACRDPRQRQPISTTNNADQVYAEPLSRRHFAGAASPAAALRGGLLVGSVVLSFLLAYATGGFWPKTAWELEQPLVHYSGDGLAVFEVGGSAVHRAAERLGWATQLWAGCTACAVASR